MKKYNIRGGENAGKVLVDDWQEQRIWQDEYSGLKRTEHGDELFKHPEKTVEPWISQTADTYRHPQQRQRRVPPRQARMETQMSRDISTQLVEEERLAEAEADAERFTRGRYLHHPQYDPDLKLDYLEDPAITLYAERGMQHGKDSHFTKPIQDYDGHETRKDD